MKKEQRYYTEFITSKGVKCSTEIELFKNSILTIKEKYINGNFDVVILSGEELQALKKMLEGVK